MPDFTMILLFAGLAATLVMVMAAFAGPSTAKATAKRLEAVRERHSRSSETVAQLQLRRIFAQRQNRMEGLAQQLIPKPALLGRAMSKVWTISTCQIPRVTDSDCDSHSNL